MTTISSILARKYRCVIALELVDRCEIIYACLVWDHHSDQFELDLDWGEWLGTNTKPFIRYVH